MFDLNGGGTVINNGSLASQLAIPQASVYSAAKAAVDSVTRTLAAELGPRKVRVNSILAGPVETEVTRAVAEWDDFRTHFLLQTPLGRIGQPEDIASVGAVSGDEAGWITSQVIPVWRFALIRCTRTLGSIFNLRYPFGRTGDGLAGSH